MMMTPNQIQSIAAAVAALRPSWDEQGIRAALLKVQDRDPFEVALAAVRAARDESNRTPAVIPLAGPHWDAETGAAVEADRRLAEKRERVAVAAAAVRECSLCDERGYRLPKGVLVCSHRPLVARHA